jgi:hypothetical protein
MAGRYPGSYLDRSNGWRAAAILADIGQASLVKRIPGIDNMIFAAAAPTRLHYPPSPSHNEGGFLLRLLV